MQLDVNVAEPQAVQPPQRQAYWRELVAVVMLVVLCDLVIYRGHGFAGYALLFVVAPCLLWSGCAGRRAHWPTFVVAVMLLLLAARTLWLGSCLLVAAGFVLTVTFAATLAGQNPYVLAVVVFASQSIRAGYEGLVQHGRRIGAIGGRSAGGRWLSVALPVLAFGIFGTIFVVANPDVLGFVSERAEILFTRLRDWLVYFSVSEVLFWIAVFWISMGLVRPHMPSLRSTVDSLLGEAIATGEGGTGEVVKSEIVESEAVESEIVPREVASSQCPLYAPYRNTLVTVIVLFAVYLMFEFATLWFRDFPDGFYYSGYAHEGAAWLTLALALATAVLSLVFHGPLLADPRLAVLRRLAWVWSLENFILAMAVYNRLLVYVGFNGMTQMRIIGFFGISTVVVGFALVVRKIATDRDFLWLVRRQAWTLAIAVYLYALTPVDTIVVSHNVSRILAGDPKPSVQIVAHPISPEGILRLHPLLDCEDETIREGVRAMLARFEGRAMTRDRQRERDGWTSLQLADRVLLRQLGENRARWDEYSDANRRQAAIDAFHEYAYQWY